jgi:tRNA-Thr(GGU) m(6)t(6)A37 methyltransferase TsaA
MLKPITLTPIGIVRNPLREPKDDVFGGLISRIELDSARFTPDSLAGLHEFSHVEIVFSFHLASESEISYGLRHPRGNPAWPKSGIFAQRGKDRPNHIGISVCRLISVNGMALEVEDLDAIDGTPVLDIKPYLAEFGPRGTVRQAAWSRELMAGYWNRPK